MSEFAEGGPVPSGQPYIVGSGGPELFVPRTAGVVLDMDEALRLWLLKLMRGGIPKKAEEE